jgi:hypothetical protein
MHAPKRGQAMLQVSGSTAGGITVSNSASVDRPPMPLWETCLQSFGTPLCFPSPSECAYGVSVIRRQ